jgi:hypothetical protein
MAIELIVAAVKRAIEQGAVPAPAIPGMSDDQNYLRAQLSVGIDPAVLASLVSTLRTDPKMAEIDGLLANTPLGTGVSVSLSDVAQLLLAQALATGDAESTVRRFADYVERNAADAMAVMAVAGIKTKQPIKLGPNVTLVPMRSLAPSSQRVAALGEGSAAFLGPRFPLPSALVADFTFRPAFYKPNNPPEKATYEVESLLEEASHPLSVLGLNSAPQMFWVQPKDLLMASGMGGTWSKYGPEFFGLEAEAPAREMEELAADYFSIEASKRAKVLRIPLDRLSRAGQERDLADRAIDLGIALESLLLHDTDGRTELNFRLRLRGAVMLGRTSHERLEIQGSLRDAYQLRSTAAHRGLLEGSEDERKTISKATDLCKRLIGEVIARQCEVDWRRLDVGDSGRPSDLTT